MGLTAPLIDALATGGVPVGVGQRPANTGRKGFVVIWPDAPRRSPRTLADRSGQHTETWVCHCFGLTPESAAIVERTLAAAVYGLHRQVVDGQVVQYPEQLSSVPLTRDDDVSPPLYDLVVEWRLRTSPTT